MAGGFAQNLTDEELVELYINQNLSAEEIAELYHTTRCAVLCVMSKRGIKKPKELSVQKQKESNLKKYGVASTFQIKEIQEKIAQTCLKKYGNSSVCSVGGVKTQEKLASHPLSDEEKTQIREKREKTSLERYGVKNYNQTEECKAKIKKTNLERYGVENPMQNKEIQQRLKQSLLDQYGVDNSMKLPATKRKLLLSQKGENYPIDVLVDEKSMAEFLDRLPYKMMIREIAQLLGCEYVTLQAILKKMGLSRHSNIDFAPNYSFAELEIKQFLEENHIVYLNHEREIIKPLELDFYCPDFALGIEFNGDYWHSDKRHSSTYHQEKSQIAEQKGIFVYHIWEHEWADVKLRSKILSQLRNLCQKDSQVFYARKCTIKEISASVANAFLDANHLQGVDKSPIRLGLFSGEQLVSVMTFCKPRFNKHYTWELSRFCCLQSASVVGGAGKLLKYFVGKYLKSNETILSYSDIAKGRGALYSSLGFQFLYKTKPNYVWCKNRQILTRYQCQMKNEEQVMTGRGYYKIYNCGNKVWVYTKQQGEE